MPIPGHLWAGQVIGRWEWKIPPESIFGRFIGDFLMFLKENALNRPAKPNHVQSVAETLFEAKNAFAKQIRLAKPFRLRKKPWGGVPPPQTPPARRRRVMSLLITRLRRGGGGWGGGTPPQRASEWEWGERGRDWGTKSRPSDTRSHERASLGSDAGIKSPKALYGGSAKLKCKVWPAKLASAEGWMTEKARLMPKKPKWGRMAEFIGFQGRYRADRADIAS